MSFFVRTRQPKTQHIGGQFTITAAGAISAFTNVKYGGAVVKTGGKSGRYTVTFTDTKYTAVLSHTAMMVGPTDAAFPTTTGVSPQSRNLSNTGFDIQFYREDTFADADPASGTVVTWSAHVVR